MKTVNEQKLLEYESEIRQMAKKAIDAIYNHNEASRAAVLMYYGAVVREVLSRTLPGTLNIPLLSDLEKERDEYKEALKVIAETVHPYPDDVAREALDKFNK